MYISKIPVSSKIEDIRSPLRRCAGITLKDLKIMQPLPNSEFKGKWTLMTCEGSATAIQMLTQAGLKREVGRYTAVPYRQRVSRLCDSAEVEDQAHFLTKYYKLNCIRQKLFSHCLTPSNHSIYLSDHNKCTFLYVSKRTYQFPSNASLLRNHVYAGISAITFTLAYHCHQPNDLCFVNCQ